MSNSLESALAQPEVLISSEAIEARCEEMANAMLQEVPAGTVHAFVVMKGAFFFAANLLRHFKKHKVELHFIQASSYHGGTVSSGELRVLTPWPSLPPQSHLLLLDDIFDTGLTLARLQEQIEIQYAPKKIITAVLLEKNVAKKAAPTIDHVGFVIEDKFVVGCGLDYKELYRQLPYVGVLDPADLDS